MSDIFNILRFFARLSKDIPFSRLILFLVVVTGSLGGVITARLLAMLNEAMIAPAIDPGIGWIYAGLCVVLVGSGLLSDLMLISVSQRVLLNLRIKLCSRIMASPLRHLEELGAPKLLAALTNDVNTLSQAFDLLPSLCLNFAMLVACLVYLAALSPPTVGLLLLFMVVGIVTYQLPMAFAMGYKNRNREETDILYHHLRGVTEGIKELKMSSHRRRVFSTDFESTGEVLRRTNWIADSILSTATSYGRALFFIALGLMVFVLRGYLELDLKVLVGFSTTLLLMITPLDVVLATLPRLAFSNISAKKIEDLGLSLDEEQIRTPEQRLLPPAKADWQSLELRDIRLSYHVEERREDFSIGPISLRFAPGELIFLTGGNGSGKTTLAKVMVGLYPAEEGEILLDGEPITEDLEQYRENFSTVFTDFFLFKKLAQEEGMDLDRAGQEYLERLALAHKVRIEDGEFSTLDLSQGQRKRLALLAAYLDDRPFYLFDEWAADQDPAFKEVFYKQLLPDLKARGKTVFVISHDDHYYHVADRVIKLDYGQLEYDREGASFAPTTISA